MRASDNGYVIDLGSVKCVQKNWGSDLHTSNL